MPKRFKDKPQSYNLMDKSRVERIKWTMDDIIHVYKARGLVAHTEARYLGPILARPRVFPMGPCEPDTKGQAGPVQRSQAVGLAHPDPLLTSSLPPDHHI